MKEQMKCYVWSIAVYAAETGTLRKVDQNYLESFICERKKDGDQLE